MQYRRFGRTELAMPVFSCGGMRYQHKWQDTPWSEIPAAGQENLAAIIDRALAVGINHIETARGYGTSEMQLGRILPHLPREKMIVQTKVSPQADAMEFRRTLEQSLGFLNLERVDLLGIHGINTRGLLADTLRPGGCLDVVREFQRQGRIRFVGFSTHGPTDVICEAIASGVFDYVNLHWYYINQENWPAIEAAQSQDMGVFIISPSDKGGRLYDPPQKLVDLCNPLSPMVFNNLFCLSHPQVHTLSIGAKSPEDFDEHLKTLPLLANAAEILPPIVARLEAEAVRCLGEEWYSTWDQGLPDPHQAPEAVSVKTILWLRNLALAYDLVEYGKARYNLLDNGGHWFPGQRLNPDSAAFKTLSGLIAESPHRHRIPALLQEAAELLGGTAVQRLSQS